MKVEPHYGINPQRHTGVRQNGICHNGICHNGICHNGIYMLFCRTPLCDRTAYARTAKNFFGNFFVNFGNLTVGDFLPLCPTYSRPERLKPYSTISDAKLF